MNVTRLARSGITAWLFCAASILVVHTSIGDDGVFVPVADRVSTESSLDYNAVDACGCSSCGGCQSSGTRHACSGLFGPCDWLGRHRSCYSREKRHGLADKHAPAGLMGDHLHDPGDWMFEYKYMNMYMDGNQIGTRSVPDNAVFGFAGTNNAATPTSMTMEMHMIHIMYGWSEDVTLYIMPMFRSLTMDHLRSPTFPIPALRNLPFTTHNSGFADLTMGALWRIYEGNTDELILNLSFSVPAGDIDRTTTIPTGVIPQEFPYPMRLGSGTFNARPGITYKSYCDHGSFGLQYQTDLPVGPNDQNYSVSKEHRLNAWYSWLACDRLAFSYRVESLWKSNFTGADPNLPQGLISTNRPDMRGGQWVNFGYGAMWLVGKGHLLNFEAVHPVYQSLNGVQLSNDWWLAASWSKAF